ncbi:MAG: hypothetical protein ACR2HM_00355, partial [Acidimicrobiales bacterium]
MGDQLGYQRAAYDDHYPKMAAALREQLAHPLLCSFYDRLAALVLDALPTGGGVGRPGGFGETRMVGGGGGGGMGAFACV